MSSPVPSVPMPAHVPENLIHPFPFAYGVTTRQDPFNDLADGVHQRPEIFFATNVGPGGTPAWIVRRAKDLREVYFDTKNFTTKDFAPYAMIIGASWSLIPVEIDPPQHALYRAFINPAFTPKAMAKLEDGIRRYAREGILAFRDQGECEFMADFAYNFPIKVFLELMGLPLQMAPQFLEWETNLLHNHDMAALAGATRSLVDYLGREIADRRKNPRDDLITYGVQAEVEGRKLTEDELIGFSFLLFIGGLDTVSANMGLHALHLAKHPEHQRFLRANPDRIPDAIEEMMRAYSPVTTFRTCVKEFEFKGVKMMPGDKIAMCTTTAGRDPEEYDNPSEVRLDRKPRHVAFGFGPHLCLGVHLARREMRIAIEEYLALMPDFQVKSGHALEWHTGIIQPVTLPLVWQS
jgi:cytochrome P450